MDIEERQRHDNRGPEPPAPAVPLDKIIIRKDLDRFKVDIINCDGWIVPPPIEASLKELCKKHNDLIEYLSLDV